MSVVWKVRLAAQAELDFSEIITWTLKKFGEHQAETYAETLTLAIEALHDGPEQLGAKARDDIGSGIRTLHVARQGRSGRHFVVFSEAKAKRPPAAATPPHSCPPIGSLGISPSSHPRGQRWLLGRGSRPCPPKVGGEFGVATGGGIWTGHQGERLRVSRVCGKFTVIYGRNTANPSQPCKKVITMKTSGKASLVSTSLK
jgi:toxin ParE1/3/4